MPDSALRALPTKSPPLNLPPVFSSSRWNPPALPCLAMTSAPWATSVPVALVTPCRVPPAPCPAPWGWGQRSSASPALLAGSAVAQGWLSWPRPRCVTQGEWHWHWAVTKHSLAVCCSQGKSKFPKPGLVPSPLVGMWHLLGGVSEPFLFPSCLPDILINLFFPLFSVKEKNHYYK